MLRLFLIITTLSLAASVISQELHDAFLSHHFLQNMEKVYVSTDKPYYVNDDMIWGKVYVVDAENHQLLVEDPIIHVNWIDPEGAIAKTFLVKTRGGVGSFHIKTDAYDKAGAYSLRAYSQWQLNFPEEYLFQKEVMLINQPVIPEEAGSGLLGKVNFFPEGGYMVDGLVNTVAFQVEDGSSVEGKIVNAAGNVITSFQSWNEGMGKFSITPETGMTYWAEMEVEGEHVRMKLPARLPTGLLLKVERITAEKIYVSVSTNEAGGLRGVRLLGHVRGNVISDFEFQEGSSGKLILERSQIPSGIVHMTLFDAGMRPVAERLVYNKNREKVVEVEIQLEERVKVESQVEGFLDIKGEGKVSGSSCSISVYKQDVLPRKVEGLDIENYLLLQSDLNGRVKNIGQYFGVDNNRTRTLQDLLMMTHAWRRFSWLSVMDDEAFVPRYPKEFSTSIAGRVFKKGTERPVKANVGLSILKEEMFSQLQQTTGADGFFVFPEMNMPEATDIMLSASRHRKRKPKKQNVDEVKMAADDNVEIVLLDASEVDYRSELTALNSVQDFKEEEEVIEVVENEVFTYEGLSVDMDEVVIKERRFSAAAKNEAVKKRYEEKGIFFFSSSEKFLVDDPQYDELKYTNIHEMLVKIIPSAKLVHSGGVRRVVIGRLSQNATARIVVDGELLMETEEVYIDPASVYSADVILGLPASSLYNHTPIISLLTRDGGAYRKRVSGVLNIKHPGYFSAREYYDSRLQGGEYDNRTTIHWDAKLELSDTDHKSFGFKTSELTGRHVVFVEGLTEDGLPFTATKVFFVE